MKIIIFNPYTNEWNEFINSLKCEGEKRNNAIDTRIAEIGQEVSASEFVKLYTSLLGKLSYKFIGEPCNPLEKLVKFVYDSSSYIYMKNNFPEDFIESRIDCEDMVNYADEMASFIKEIMEDIANTKTL